MLYIGHVYVIQCAKIVLPRDPSARALMRGSVAGTVFLVIVFSVWVLAIGGALTPEELAGQAGTALTPLAEKIGPSIHVLGSLLVVLLLGMSCLRTSTVLFNIAQEYIPIRPRSLVTLPRRRARVILAKRRTPSSGPRLALTYLGLSEGQPQFRLDLQLGGDLHRLEMTVANHWDESALLERFPQLRSHGISLSLDVAEASPESARLQVTSPMNLWYEGDWDEPGLHLADVGTLRDPLRQLLNWITRRGEVALSEVRARTGENEKIALRMIEELIELGFVRALDSTGDPRYRIHLATRQSRQLPVEIWQSLDETVGEKTRSGSVSRKPGSHPIALWFRRAMVTEGGRFFLSTSPVLLVFLIAGWLLLTGSASFAGVLGFGGVVANSLTGGIFPVLLLVSSRRKGDFTPGVVYRVLDHPLCVSTIYLVFLGILLLHGLFIWQNPLARGIALLFGLLVIGITVLMFRRGAFSRRTVVELRGDAHEGGGAIFTISNGGEAVTANIDLRFSNGEETRQTAAGEISLLSKLRYASFHLPAIPSREIKVWAHRITPEGNSEALPALLEVQNRSETKTFDLKLTGGQVILPHTGGEFSFRIVFPEAETLPGISEGAVN
jgi:hypothetical protein